MKFFLLFLFLIALGLFTFGIEGTALTVYICVMVDVLQSIKVGK